MLTPWLRDNVRDGDAILFLGAGAIKGAVGSNGETPPDGSQLRDKLADRFLGGAHKDKPLARVAEYAKNESSIVAVQGFIRDLLVPINPPSHFSVIPTFRWFAIVTTNYDLSLERAYAASTGRMQELQPILRDGDRLATVLRDDKSLPLLKLHGCISEVTDPNLPLILASEEYAKHRRNRERLFRNFQDWARERPVVFAGYDIADPNILQILFDLTDMGISRPQYAVVDPGLDDIASRYWASKRFVPIPQTFEAFLAELSTSIDPRTRVLASLRSKDAVSFQKWVSTHTSPSDRLLNYLATEVAHIHPRTSMRGVSAKEFYSGASIDWAAIADGFNVRRRVGDDLILESVLSQTSIDAPRVFLLKGHAGVGLSVALRQIAWEAARDFDALVLFLNEGGLIRPDLVAELVGLVQTRILLVVDDAIPHLADIEHLASKASAYKLPIDILLAARTNEWNVAISEGLPFDVAEYELRDLTDPEIEELIEKLTLHNCLGELHRLSHGERIDRFRQFSGRQLIVALHEATTGKPFEELVFDEYGHITPARAKILYLDICTLHRLGVSIRAGLVARVSGITFSEFSTEFFRPLEHVVFAYFDHASRDYAYRTRHPVIAEFVFQQALRDPVDRAAQIKRIIRHMNVDYESDAEAFAQLIRGKTLADLFADKALAKEIFDSAAEAGASRSHINHQRAIFELNHKGGDLRAAWAAIKDAEAEQPRERYSLEHTKALILRKLALSTTHALERDKLRADARQILKKLVRSSRTPHAVSTLAQITLDDLRDLLTARTDTLGSADELQRRAVAETIREIEQLIYSGLQQFPNDEYLLAHDAELSKLLDDYPKAQRSLRDAFEANPARSFIAVRLARFLEQSDCRPAAIDVLSRCLAANPGSKECHLELALLQMKSGEGANLEAIGYNLKRSFTEGDSNLHAQFWWARHEYLYGDREAAVKRFQNLARTRIGGQYRQRPIGPLLGDDGKPRRFSGTVVSSRPTYCFVRSRELGTDIFVGSWALENSDWQRIHVGAQLTFGVAFSARGAEGIQVNFS